MTIIAFMIEAAAGLTQVVLHVVCLQVVCL
jgi:hypothetical protein